MTTGINQKENIILFQNDQTKRLIMMRLRDVELCYDYVYCYDRKKDVIIKTEIQIC